MVGIDETLYSQSRSAWRKQKLAVTKNRSFQGSTILGLGFTMSAEQAQLLINKDPRNADVLFPYLGGEDLNQSPTQTASRWVINFFDWPEERARRYRDCFTIVEESVKPQRIKHLAKRYGISQRRGTRWWLYSADSASLYRALANLDRVMAICLVSNAVLPVTVPTGQVFSHKVGVFAYDDDFHFGVLTSGFHFRWALRHSSTLGLGLNYSPSDVFETFPQPTVDGAIADAGKALGEYRLGLMAEGRLGLTSLYNRFHDPFLSDPGITRLRELHVNLDRAVLGAYGWSNLDLGHGFYEVRGQGVRFTFSPEVADEILDCLLELNKERYEAEVAAGLHGKAEAKTSMRKVDSAEQRSLLAELE